MVIGAFRRNGSRVLRIKDTAQAQEVGLDGAEEGSQEQRKEAWEQLCTFLCMNLGRSLLFSRPALLQRQGEGPREAALTAAGGNPETPISTSCSLGSRWARGGQAAVAPSLVLRHPREQHVKRPVPHLSGASCPHRSYLLCDIGHSSPRQCLALTYFWVWPALSLHTLLSAAPPPSSPE